MAPKVAKGERKVAADDEAKDVQAGNIQAGKDIADLVRTSLGPRGMDKLLIEPKGDVIITNDGATILNKLQVNHPCAKMLVDVAKAQDVEAGDGTTSVVVLVGALLKSVEELLAQNIHPAKISEAFQVVMVEVERILNDMSIPLSLEDKDAMVQAAITSLSSKVVSQYSHALAPMAVDAVRKIYRPPSREDDECNVDLSRIKVVKFPSGTIDDCELVDGMILPQKASKMAGGPTKVANAKIALIQFQLSPPKTDMENNVVVTDYSQIDRVIREEREYLLKAVKKIKATGCNVLLIQKSILRDAVTETSLQMLKTAKIMVIRDIERADIDFIASSLGCMPIASLNGFKAEKLGTAEKVEEISAGDSKYVKFTGLKNSSTTNPCVSVLVKGATQLIVDEADRSLHDALCVVRSLHKRRALIPGGGAAEMELAVKLLEFARTKEGVIGHCIKTYAEAFEIIPYTLAENAGLRPVEITTELRNQHANKENPNKHAGINVRQSKVTDMTKENVIQPLLVTLSAVKLATETVVMILKIDDMLSTR